MKKNKVSIVVPVHNSEKYIQKCINSILNQTYKDIEIIVVVNGSSDSSFNILRKYQGKLKIINIAKASIGNARNVGIKKVTGKYILFFDSDDFMEKEMIEELVLTAEKDNLDLVISDYYECKNAQKKEIKTYDFKIGNIFLISDLIYKISYGPVKLFKKEIILKNNIKFPVNLKYEDVNFVAKYLIYAKKIGKINKPLYNYVIHNDSEQTTVNEKVFDILKVINILKEDYKQIRIIDLTSLCVKTLLTFALKQKYQQDKSLRDKFIDEVFEYLNVNFPGWKNCEYLKNEPLIKKIVKRNRLLVEIYCKIGFIN